MMETYFFDSRALVKEYVAVMGSLWIANRLIPTTNAEIYIAKITGAEVVAAFARRLSLQSPVPSDLKKAIARFKRDFPDRFGIVDISTTLVLSAMNLAERHSLRGYDAVQLAAVLEVNAEYSAFGSHCTLVSADLELNAAPAAEGLIVENPNDPP